MENLKRKKSKKKVSKKRRIKYTHSSNWGIIFTDKNISDKKVEFESTLEEGFYHLIDHDPNAIEVESQPFEILNPKTNRNLYPDAYVKFKDGTEYVYQIKYKSYLDSLKDNLKERNDFIHKTKIIMKYCKDKGYKFDIVTDNEIWNTRFDNLNFFMKNKRNPDQFSRVIPYINSVLNEKKSFTRIELAYEISKIIKIDHKAVIPTIDHLIYHDYFLLDFNTIINDDTVLKLKGLLDTKLEPIYNYFSQRIIKRNKETLDNKTKFVPSPKDPEENTQKEDFNALPEKTKNEILKKIEMLKIFDERGVTAEILDEFAKKNGVSRTSLYNWRKLFEQHGWRGLIPQHKKAGRKTSYKQRIWEIADNVIKEKYFLKTKPSIKSCHDLFVERCLDEILKPFSYATFKNYVNKISNSKKVRMRYGIKKERDGYKPIGLFGKYRFGKFPLDGVEFDHSELDITVVDREERKPIGDHPILTLAVDVYSRMIYGYYLSLDHQSLLTVGMCLLRGILPKDDLTKLHKTTNNWTITGLPKSIILDNAKEFVSPQLNSFLDRHKIIKRFNPVHRPDYKPFVERMIRTINESIKNDFIEGYRIPLKDKRDTEYDHEKHAEMTFEEFETWFIHWIVDEYHQRIHGGIKKLEGVEISPGERYEMGLENSNGRTVGLPDIPKDWKQLRLDLLPFKERTLRREGISLERLQYNNPIIRTIRSRDFKAKQNNKKYIIKFDARDLKEVYLWDDVAKEYHDIPLRNVYFTDLKIDPLDENNYPLSLEELKAIKKIQKSASAIASKSSFSEYKLVETRKKRRQIIEDARKKTKTAKKARKLKEKSEINRNKATSTQIRNKINQIELEEKKDEKEKEKEADIVDIDKIREKLKKRKFPTSSFPKKTKRGSY